MSGMIEQSALLEVVDRVEQHAAEIYVRANLNGTWGNYALTELPAEQAIQWFAKFLRNRFAADSKRD